MVWKFKHISSLTQPSLQDRTCHANTAYSTTDWAAVDLQWNEHLELLKIASDVRTRRWSIIWKTWSPSSRPLWFSTTCALLTVMVLKSSGTRPQPSTRNLLAIFTLQLAMLSGKHWLSFLYKILSETCALFLISFVSLLEIDLDRYVENQDSHWSRALSTEARWFSSGFYSNRHLVIVMQFKIYQRTISVQMRQLQLHRCVRLCTSSPSSRHSRSFDWWLRVKVCTGAALIRSKRS